MKMKPFGLMPAELLQIINLAPKTTVELYNLIEDIDSRFGEDKMEEILIIVSETLLS